MTSMISTTSMTSRRALAPLLLAAVLAVCAAQARAGDCSSFAWNVAHERALFATRPQEETAGSDAASAPRIMQDRLYRLALVPQEKVTFGTLPGKKALTNGSYAGVVRIHVAVAGMYRISMSRHFWVDIVKDGKLIPSTNFTGASGCSAPRKIVQYQLPAGNVLLQISQYASPQVNLTVTREPKAAAGQRAATKSKSMTVAPH